MLCIKMFAIYDYLKFEQFKRNSNQKKNRLFNKNTKKKKGILREKLKIMIFNEDFQHNK